MTISEILHTLDRITPPHPSWPAGWLQSSTGEPTDAASPFFFAYEDTESGKIYVMIDRAAGLWEEITSAEDLTPSGETLLTADA